MLLSLSTAQAVFAVAYKEAYHTDNIVYLWYSIIVIMLVVCFLLVFVLPTPSEKPVLTVMTEEVIKTADIQVKEIVGMYPYLLTTFCKQRLLF